MLQAALLSLVAGYADAVGYLRFGAFAGMMTGNAVFFAMAAMEAQPWHAAAYAAIILSFLAGVVFSRMLLRLGSSPVVPLTVTAATLVLCDALPNSWAAPTLALAMGTQNSAVTRIAGIPINTVFITGNLQRLGEGLVQRLWPVRAEGRSDAAPIGLYAMIWLGYPLGAALGALAQKFVAWPLVAPAVVLPFVLLPIRPSRAAR
jgi:uncharacterized membrane protein YoaK (UPF0700 family)